MEFKVIGTINGTNIYDGSAIGCHPHRMDIAEEAISLMRNFDPTKCFHRETVEFNRIIGLDHCVETDRESEIFYMTRGARPGKTRFVLNRNAEPTNKCTLIVCRAGEEDGEFEGKFVLLTLFEGAEAPKEPFDKFSTEEAQKASVEFWNTHALVPTDDELKIIKEWF